MTQQDGSRHYASWQRLVWTISMTWVWLPSVRAVQSSVYSGSGAMINVSDINHAGCGFISWPVLAETHYAAMLDSPTPQPSKATVETDAISTSACGRCVRVWRDDPVKKLNNTRPSTVVYIVDDQRSVMRTNSSRRHINLSPLVFVILGGRSSDRIPIQWQFVDCPPFQGDRARGSWNDTRDTEGCAICVHRDSTPYWVSLQPVNDTLGVASLRVNSQLATLNAKSPAYFFNVADVYGRLNSSNLEISITTRNQQKFTRHVAIVPGSCAYLRSQDEVATSLAPSSSHSADDENDLPTDAPTSSSPPQSTIGPLSDGGLSRGSGVITNPWFVGLLLGIVGLVGAIVVCRARARQRLTLAFMSPTSTSAEEAARRAVSAVSSNDSEGGNL